MSRFRRWRRTDRLHRGLPCLVGAVVLALVTSACAPDPGPDALAEIRADLQTDPWVVEARVGSGQLLPFTAPSIGFTLIVADRDPGAMEELVRQTAERIWHTPEVRRIAEITGRIQTEDLAHTVYLGEALGFGTREATVQPDDLERAFGPRFADS